MRIESLYSWVCSIEHQFQWMRLEFRGHLITFIVVMCHYIKNVKMFQQNCCFHFPYFIKRCSCLIILSDFIQILTSMFTHPFDYLLFSTRTVFYIISSSSFKEIVKKKVDIFLFVPGVLYQQGVTELGIAKRTAGIRSKWIRLR